MNSDKHSARRTAGNAMIYILLALALIGALTMVIARQNDQASNESIDAEKADIMAAQIIAYAASAQNALEQMEMTGTQPSTLSFVKPSDGTFNTAPHGNKLFHPQGGGLNPGPSNADIFTGTASPTAGWYISRFNNVTWTPTSANDVIVSAYQISEPVCKAINKKIIGTTVIPAMGGSGNPANVFLGTANGAAANENFTGVECTSCSGNPAMCISNAAGTLWAFYSIISGQ